MKRLAVIFSLFTAIFCLPSAKAQCEYANTAFKGGEFLSYNLYYNWKFIWVKAGSASFSTVTTKYKGYDAYRASLITRGNKKVDEMFVLRDTLLCYATTKLAPLYFRKGAREGKRYTVDEVFYSYVDGQTQIRQHRQRNDGQHEWRENAYQECVYDMMNIFLRARNFSAKGWKKGHTISIPIADGNGMTTAQLRYRGTCTVKADNGVKYRCLQLSYMELEKGKYKEIVRFYVSDDQNHVPIRLDLFLRFGSAKAFLNSMKEVRSPMQSVVR